MIFSHHCFGRQGRDISLNIKTITRIITTITRVEHYSSCIELSAKTMTQRLNCKVFRTTPLLLSVLLTAVLSLTGCGDEKSHTVVKLAHGLDQNHPTHKAMVFMAERLEQISDGQMRMDIYPAGQLGQERDLLELLQIGSLAMTKVSASPLEGFIPEFKLFSIPYVFNDQEHFWSSLQGDVGRELLAKGETVRLRGLTYYDAGSRSFYTVNQPVHSPDDLAGLKIRVQKSQTSVTMVNKLGGSGTPVDWGELYTALQQGVVDGAENNPPSFYLSKHYEVCRYFSLDEHTYVPDVLLISRPIWENLSPQEQQWLQQAANDSSQFQRELWQQETAKALQALREDGVTIIQPDKQAFRDKVSEMFDVYEGTAVGKLINTIQSTRSESQP